MHINSSESVDNVHWDRNFIYCYKCKNVILNYDRQLSRFNKEGGYKRTNSCFKHLCRSCSSMNKNEIENLKSVEKKSKADNYSENTTCNFKKICICLGILFVIACYLFYLRQEMPQVTSKDVLKKLNLKFPSQKNETWNNILSVIDNSAPSVKSIIFLHGEDRETLNCLIKNIVLLYTRSKITDIQKITFKIDVNVMDYGELLVTYIQKVKEHGILVINNIDQVPGYIAKIFHSLCDEISSDIKPSLYIFTLQYKENSEKLKPITRAATILRNTWKELPLNDLDPLLSRIVRNVVMIIPEKKTC